MSSTILVAESDAAIRSLVRDMLKARGYEVETAPGLAAASALATGCDPALVLAAPEPDQDMQVFVAGFSTLPVPVPVILLLEGREEIPAEIAEQCGAMGYLKKPLDRSQMFMLVRQGMAFRQSQESFLSLQARADLMVPLLHAAIGLKGGVVYILDREITVLHCEGPVSAMPEGMEDGLEGRSYLELLPPEVKKLHAEGFAKAREKGVSSRLEEHRGGSVLETVINPVHDPNGLLGFVVCQTDITAKRRSEVELARSEKQYRSVFNGGATAIIVADRESGEVVDCNRAASKSLGYTPSELRGRHIHSLVVYPEQTMQAVESGLERIAYEYLRRRNGSSFPVELVLGYFANAGREMCILYAQDISRRKIVEEALREGARLYRAVVEDQTELICRYTPDKVLTFVNQAFARFMGEDEDEMVGTECFTALSDGDRNILEAWLARADVDDAVLDWEVRQSRADGEMRWIHWTKRAMVDDKGVVSEIQAVGRDITDRKDAEHALNQATLEKEQYRINLEATFASIPDAILTVDGNLKIMATNDAANHLFGFTGEEPLNLPLTEFTGSDQNPCIGVIKQVISTDKAVRGYEIELETPSLGERMVELNCSPLVGKDGQHGGAVLIARDVSHIADLEKQLHQRHGFRGLVGRSNAMQDVYQLVEQLSSLESIVLILGESGTGKELVAEALHYGGVRAGKPLVKVNCSALSESLLESELFGHVRGAFTGAVRDKVGRIQAAQGGTLFLDEIGDISPMLQLKLLRFLEQKEYERVGESKTLTADVRVIAATNVNLRKAVRQGSFREDLYYRLNVMPVYLPPLRERQADIPLLTDHFLGLFAESFGKSFEGVAPEVMDLFMSHHWPGNVRELRHALEHACILCPGKTITLRHMPRELVERRKPEPEMQPPMVVPHPSFMAVPARPGREDILMVLDRCGGNKARAARELGIHRATLYRKLKTWGVES